MKLTVWGSGYVGLVTGACLAQVGNHVICVDVDRAKVERLQNGEVPIHEPGLEAIVREALTEGTLRFTTDAAAATAHGTVQFIAVGTPPDEDGSADLRHVLAVARTIGQHLQRYAVVVTKSTVPVGTAERVRETLRMTLAGRDSAPGFDVASNPEFLKEGAAVADFTRPDRIIVGADSPRVESLMRELYAPFNRNHDRLMVMDIRSAELTKYAANAMLATKISFMNEMAHVAERLGADIERVRLGIGADQRIGYDFIYPGCGYGGSCFPKDVKALIRAAGDAGIEPAILAAVERRNEAQKKFLYRKIHDYFGGDLAGRTIALWGLAFKPNTDDMREAPSRALMEALWEAGARVRAFDPKATGECRRLYGARSDLTLCDDAYEALEGSDALAICTEWKLFRSPDFERIRANLTRPAVFDGRNLYDPARLREYGLTYYAVGRGEPVPVAPLPAA
jgi:UDPglucose 6-dehydrogenase